MLPVNLHSPKTRPMQRSVLTALCSALAFVLCAQTTNYPIGSTVADFTVTDTEGNVHTLYNYTAQGKYVLLDFFFDTCPPCQATSQYFSQLHETYGCNDGDIICIAMNDGTDSNAEVDAYEATFGGPWAHPPAIGIEGGCAAVDAAFGVNAYPTYCLIGPDNLMKNNDIWPLTDMNTFVSAFPAGSNINPMACAVGVNEPVAASFRAWPTLTSGRVEVRIARTDAQGTMVVRDPLGHTVLTTPANGMGRLDLDLGGLADGTYLISLLSAGREDGPPTRVVLAR